jgi:nitroreductase
MAPLVSNIDGSSVLLVIVLNVNNAGFGSSIQDSLRLRDLQTWQRESLPTDFLRGCTIEIEREVLMEVFDAVRTALAVRQFQDKPIPEPIVGQIVEAGRLTASSMNGQPWHFIVIQDKEMLRQLGALAPTGRYIAQAPLAIVVAMEQSRFAISDGSRAIQSMILTAWSQGIGSNWVGFNNLKQINPVLGIPQEIDILAIVPFGYPAEAIGKGKKNRKPLGEVAYRERWDQPFA